MTRLQIELPDSTAQAARAAGLLTPQVVDRLLIQALRRQNATNALLAVADQQMPCTPKVPNAETRLAMAEVDAIAHARYASKS